MEVDLEGEVDRRWVRGVRLHCPCGSDGRGSIVFEKACVRTIRTETSRGRMVDVWAMRHLICHTHVQEDIVVHVSLHSPHSVPVGMVCTQFCSVISVCTARILYSYAKYPILANHAATAAAATISHLITSMVTLTSSGEERGSNYNATRGLTLTSSFTLLYK